METVKKHEWKKYLMINDYLLDKVLVKIKEITGIEKPDNAKILTDTYGKLPDYRCLDTDGMYYKKRS